MSRKRYSKYATEYMGREFSGAGMWVLDFNEEILAGKNLTDLKISELAEMLENYAFDLLTDNDVGGGGLFTLDCADEFLRQVNYRAIARQLLEGRA